MENKKALIIIPPMSQALQKLHEVLEGIAGEENIDISIIDDLRELGQFLASSGQCLILCSNPKKCATFLQENRFVISRFHSKTILLTPTEIPAKTLVKFTKVGLTESILDTSAPKTLLYKIKLQLRSIKTTSNEEKNREVVKSMLDTNADVNSAFEEEKIHHETAAAEESPLDEGQKQTHTADEITLDLGEQKRKKMTQAEEVIDTHWKSKRKKTETTLDVEHEDSKAESEDHEAIDSYYHGKIKKESAQLEQAEDYRKLKRLEKEAAEEAERKRTAYRDDVSEELMRQKKIGDEYSYDSDSPLESKDNLDSSMDLDKTEDAAAKKKMDYDPDDNDDHNKKTIDLNLEAGEKKSKQREIEDLGGHYKGKISEVGIDLDSAPDITEEKKEYVNTDLDEEKEKLTEIDLIAAKKRREDLSEEEATPYDAHDGEVDKITEEQMDGKNSTDHIETYMGRERKASDAKTNATEEDFDLENLDKNNYERQDNDHGNKSKLDLSPANQKEKEKKIDYESDGEFGSQRNNESKIDLEEGKARNKDKAAYEDEDFSNEIGLEKNLVDSSADNGRNDDERKQLDQRDISLKKLSQSNLDLEKGRKEEKTNQTEKIDTYYRSHDSKNNDQDWDLKHDKKSSELNILKTQNPDVNINLNNKSKDNGEITIDYRKLKEEFDLISKGEITGSSDAISKSKAAGTDSEDEGTFQVIELNTRGIDFSVSLLNLIYQKNIKPKQIFISIAEEILLKYGGMTIFWDYKNKKHNEVYNTYLEFVHPENTGERKDWWLEYKKDKELFDHFQSRSMGTWRCPQIMDKNAPWEDVELPTWAKNELTDKTVELAFPYFDGVDRMGLALVIFHKGLNAELEHSILTSLEMARHVLLDTIQRSNVNQSSYSSEEDSHDNQKEETNKKVLNFFGGLFGKKKAG